MKKMLASALFILLSSHAFANSMHVNIDKNNLLKNPENNWSISSPSDIVSFTNIATTPLNLQVYVEANSSEGTPDDATITCNGKDYVLKPSSSLVCPVAVNQTVLIQDKVFKHGTSGTYSVLD